MASCKDHLSSAQLELPLNAIPRVEYPTSAVRDPSKLSFSKRVCVGITILQILWNLKHAN